MNPTPLTIYQGRTFSQVFRWSTLPYIYKAITAITQTGPVSITSTGHGLTPNWPVAVVSVKGMTQINAAHNPPRDSEMDPCTVVDPNTITINDKNSALYQPYTSGGYLQFYTPVDMTGYTASMSIKDRVGGTILLSLSTVAGSIVIDNTNKSVTLALTPTITAALVWTKGVYDIEMIAPTGVSYPLAYGTVTVTDAVTLP
jgi:hypothetical protein